MKYLLTRNNFIKEYKIEYTKSINLDFINSQLDYVWNPNDKQIYKGVKIWDKIYRGENWKWRYPYPDVDSHIFHIDDTERKGKSDYKIVYGLASWKKFTNRYKSIIGTTDEEYAKTCGNLFVVVPLKNEIVVGVNEDFNKEKCFPYFDEIFETYNADMIVIVRTIINYAKRVGFILPYLDINDINDIFNLTEEQSKMVLDNIYETGTPKLKGLITSQKFNTFLELIDYVLDPIRNGYKKMKYTDFINSIDDKSSIEVWFESDCFFITNEDLEKLKK